MMLAKVSTVTVRQFKKSAKGVISIPGVLELGWQKFVFILESVWTPKYCTLSLMLLIHQRNMIKV